MLQAILPRAPGLTKLYLEYSIRDITPLDIVYLVILIMSPTSPDLFDTLRVIPTLRYPRVRVWDRDKRAFTPKDLLDFFHGTGVNLDTSYSTWIALIRLPSPSSCAGRRQRSVRLGGGEGRQLELG